MTDPTPTEDADRVRKLLRDSDLMRAYWEAGHSHLWSRSWDKARQAVGGWLLGIILSGAAAAIIVMAVQRGWIK